MFDAALIESGSHLSFGNRRGSLPLAVGLHAGALGTPIGGRRWRYRAATLNGRPVAVFLSVTVSFGLR